MVLFNKTLKASTDNFGKEMLNTGSFTKLSKIVIATHTGGADQVVGVGPGQVSVMGHAAHHHHHLPPGAHDLDLGVGLPVLGRALA